MIVFYIVASIAILLGIFSLLEGVRATEHIRSFRPRASWRPTAVVFCPCKGIDPEFRKNIASLLKQEYPSFRTFFIVESEQDPAWLELKSTGATVLVAG